MTIRKDRSKITMMITIKCDKCGTESDNQYRFDNKRFYFVDSTNGNALRHVHLCGKCQGELSNSIEKAIALFIGCPGLTNWQVSDKIV